MSDDAAQGTLGEDMLVFVGRVRGEAALERDVDAEVLARATMRALGAQITEEASTGLTAGLPEELVAELDAFAPGDQAEFDRGVFLDRVAGELGGRAGLAGPATATGSRPASTPCWPWCASGRRRADSRTRSGASRPRSPRCSPDPVRFAPDGAARAANRW